MNHEDAPTSEPKLEEWLKCAIDQHEHALVRYAQQFVGDVERARDVVQDTFMKLCDHQRKLAGESADLSFSDPSNCLTGIHQTKWLYKVCRNRAIDVARKENRMKSAPPGQFDEQVASTVKTPEAEMLAAERQQTLIAQIDRLPPNQQEVLRLKFHGGMSYQEIADITGHSKTNVGFLLHTAISKLRQRVAADS